MTLPSPSRPPADAARDNWVRVRTGLYKDDLAKVVDVDFAAQKVIIHLLPRLDLNAMATKVGRGRGDEGGRGRWSLNCCPDWA